MSLLTAGNLAKRFGPLDVFQGVNLRIEKGDRIGLVGPNGEGKTTLLRLLAGLDAPSEGQLYRMRGLTIGYLPQEPPPADNRTLWEDVTSVFEPLRRMVSRLQRLEELMADPVTYEAALAEYGPLQARFEAAGGYHWEQAARQMLTGLGFPPAEHHLPLAHLSGGQRTRGLLAKLLLQKPTLLLLDEPTNHLDLQATEWLEQVLLRWEGSLVVVSHDRYFLDRIVSRIWELADQRLEIYRGNYTHYAQQREARRERQRREWARQQALIAKEEEFIRRNIAGQKTRQAQSRRKRLKRMRREGLVERPHERRKVRLNIETRLRSGDLVLTAHDLVVGYRQARPDMSGNHDQVRRSEISGGILYQALDQPIGPADTVLFRCPHLELRRGQRVALIGPNGAGKSTFLKTILGQLPPLAGRLRVGASVRIGYLAQAQTDLRPEMTVLEAVREQARRMDQGQLRSFLGGFLFSGDEVFKPVATLSGGQRSRLALARLTLQGANFLLLDEPTNHLDIPTQEVLEDVLKTFPGTVLLVTHDRYLVDAVATQVWAIEGGYLRIYEGNYSAYQVARLTEGQARDAQQPGNGKRSASEAKQHRWRTREEHRRRRLAEKRRAEADRLEELIHSLEQRLATLGEDLSQASAAGQAERIRELSIEYRAVDERLNQLIEEWSVLAS